MNGPNDVYDQREWAPKEGGVQPTLEEKADCLSRLFDQQQVSIIELFERANLLTSQLRMASDFNQRLLSLVFSGGSAEDIIATLEEFGHMPTVNRDA